MRSNNFVLLAAVPEPERDNDHRGLGEHNGLKLWWGIDGDHECERRRKLDRQGSNAPERRPRTRRRQKLYSEEEERRQKNAQKFEKQIVQVDGVTLAWKCL